MLSSRTAPALNHRPASPVSIGETLFLAQISAAIPSADPARVPALVPIADAPAPGSAPVHAGVVGIALLPYRSVARSFVLARSQVVRTLHRVHDCHTDRARTE